MAYGNVHKGRLLYLSSKLVVLPPIQSLLAMAARCVEVDLYMQRVKYVKIMAWQQMIDLNSAGSTRKLFSIVWVIYLEKKM